MSHFQDSEKQVLYLDLLQTRKAPKDLNAIVSISSNIHTRSINPCSVYRKHYPKQMDW